MPQRIAKTTLYLNADKSKFVKEDDPAAASLFVREGSAVNESDAARLEKAGVDMKLLKTTDHDLPHPRDLHDAEYNPPAAAEAEPEPEAKAKPAAENKAVAKAPANKAKE